jgi:hypothetical protein
VLRPGLPSASPPDYEELESLRATLGFDFSFDRCEMISSERSYVQTLHVCKCISDDRGKDFRRMYLEHFQVLYVVVCMLLEDGIR